MSHSDNFNILAYFFSNYIYFILNKKEALRNFEKRHISIFVFQLISKTVFLFLCLCFEIKELLKIFSFLTPLIVNFMGQDKIFSFLTPLIINIGLFSNTNGS